MSSSDPIVRSAAEWISLSFDLSDVDSISEDQLLEQVRNALISRIAEMLNSNPEKLMSILYRIDVPEAVVNEIFDTAFPTEVPELLANLVINRQLAKARTRAEYRS